MTHKISAVEKVTSQDPRLAAVAASIVSGTIDSETDRINKIQAAAEKLSKYGVNIQEVADDPSKLLDVLLNSILQLEFMYSTSVKAADTDDFVFVDVNTSDPNLSQDYADIRQRYLKEVAGKSYVTLIDSYGDDIYWKKLSQVHRVIHSSILLDIATEINFVPPEVWLHVHGTNGNRV